MENEKLAKIFKALANEQRLKLFKMIYYWNQTVNTNEGCCPGVERSFTKACDCMDLSKATISHHFKELQNADLITCTRNGQFFSCNINMETVNAIKDFI